MAAYREHISVSTLIGIGYGVILVGCGVSPVRAALAGVLTAIAGMLPDLDSETGTPVREMSALTAASIPVLMMQYLLTWGGDPERALLAGVLMYLVVRYGGRRLLARMTVHRGMFHSTPAIGIAAGIVFLLYHSDEILVKLIMAGGIAIGYLSHLVLDELYSVEWSGARVRLKKSAGSALKSVSRSVPANAITYGLLFATGYICYLQVQPAMQAATEPAAAPIAERNLESAPEFDAQDDGVPIADTPPIADDAKPVMFAEEIPLDVPRRY